MAQTLLALAAIFAFAYLALGRQQHDRSVGRQAIAAELDLAAVDLARARMTALQGLAFDEDDDGGGGLRRHPSTRPLGPDAGEAGPPDYDDIDDWDGYDALATVPLGVGTVTFRERVAVRYVEDRAPDTPAAGATLTKEVVVTLEEVPGGPTDRPPSVATLRRAVTPAGAALTRDR